LEDIVIHWKIITTKVNGKTGATFMLLPSTHNCAVSRSSSELILLYRIQMASVESLYLKVNLFPKIDGIDPVRSKNYFPCKAKN
jgi:hypothetical protein